MTTPDRIADFIVQEIAALVREEADDPALTLMLSFDATDLDWYLLAYSDQHEDAVQA